jgi:multicomponent Na+:H+ antiporter subunit G
MAVFELLRSVIGGALIVVGIVGMLGGVVGLLRFPDFYTRLHALNAGHAIGALVFLAGLMVLSTRWDVAVHVGLLFALVAAVRPTLAYITASAAHAAGLTPLSGKYTAPRPGRRPERAT